MVPYQYDLLSIGDVTPQGWIKDQLQLQASGLSGNLFKFYRYVKASTWLGGTEEYSELHESAPYWYNAIVPLAYVLDDERLKALKGNMRWDRAGVAFRMDGQPQHFITSIGVGIRSRCMRVLSMPSIAMHART